MIRTLEKPVAGLSKVLMLVASLLMVLAPEAPGALAQEKATGFDPYPLRPPDTSSPRDTLRSFLTNTNAFIEDWRRNPSALGTESYRAYTRAIETLDLSTTTDQNSRMVRTLRVLFLKEILDRIEVPPNTEIPGDGEVADGSITQWTIPNTRITIAKIEEGLHAGEFLFSANTVQQLDRLYRHARHLPYKPGASIGIYEDFIRSDRTPAALERKLRKRLKPVDTSNPRSTLEGFLDSVNRAFALVTETNEALKSTPPTVTKDEAREVEILAANLLARAIVTLDLSQVPKALRQDIGVESVLMLKEILDRALLPQMGTIPNAEMVAAARKEGSRLFLRTGGPLRWRYPNSEIEIVEITEGERQGQFLFSASTVNRLSNFYKEIRDLPYRRTDFGSLVFDYLSPDLSPGFYEFYISTPGYLIPHAHFLGELLDALPSGFEKLHGGHERIRFRCKSGSTFSAN